MIRPWPGCGSDNAGACRTVSVHGRGPGENPLGNLAGGMTTSPAATKRRQGEFGIVSSLGVFLIGGNQLSESLLSTWILLAQDAAPADPAPGGGGGSFLLPMAIIMLLFYFLILRPQKNKDQAMRTMIDSLKEKDRVVTIGGIHGVVTNVQRDQGMVTLRVDESTGAKIHVGTSAIARVVVDEEKNEKQ